MTERFPAIATGKRLSCAVETTLDVIGGRWKVLILRELFVGTRRFAELHRAVRGVTQKMLTQQLRELERDGLVRRQVYPQVPPKVEYSLTELGQTLWPVLETMHDWGAAYLDRRIAAIDAARSSEDAPKPEPATPDASGANPGATSGANPGANPGEA